MKSLGWFKKIFAVLNGIFLILKEPYAGEILYKFPGGGLEFGESLIDGLKRELKEELNLDLTEASHFYTQEEFLVSKFRANELSRREMVRPIGTIDSMLPSGSFRSAGKKRDNSRGLRALRRHLHSIEARKNVQPLQSAVTPKVAELVELHSFRFPFTHPELARFKGRSRGIG